MESRINKAIELHRKGFNCAQAVFAAYADLYKIDEETALKISSSFGGGLGGSRHICGAISGMAMIAGMETGSCTAGDKEGKKQNYDRVKLLLNDFENEYGSVLCKHLRGIETGDKAVKVRPCNEYIRYCAQLIEEQFCSAK